MSPNTMIAENSIPNFLLKLWKLVEDAQYRQCIRWDDTGFSFHVREPYTFSKGILPLYFKHSNLNSFIRQLNMYGFRKVTNLDKGSLKQNTDQHDSLEFQHPYFVRGHAELLQYIKRKAANSKNGPEVVEPGQTNNNSTNNNNVPPITMTMNGHTGGGTGHCNGRTGSSPTSMDNSADLNQILGDVRLLRDKQMGMDARLNQVKKENQALWREVGRMHQLHMKQQQIVNKLIQLLLSLVQPGTVQRLGKRHLLAIGGPTGLLNGNGQQQELDGIAKRLRTSNDESTTQIIESLQQESERNANNLIIERHVNLIIADVTDEFETDAVQCQYNHQQRRNSINEGMNHNQVQHRAPSPRVNQSDDITGSYQQRQQMNSSLLTPSMIVPTSNCVVVSRQNGLAISSGSEWNSSVNSPVNQSEFSDYLDFVQSDLDSLKTLLASESLNLDNEALSSLFIMADETNNLMASAQQLKEPQNEFAMSADIVGNEMQVYKRPEVLVPPEPGMKQQMKPNQSQTNDNNKPTSAPLPQLLPPLPPPPPNFGFFQRQSSVPAYYGGHNPMQMQNHYNHNNFVQQNTGRPTYINCSNQQLNGIGRMPSATGEDLNADKSNMILNSLFSSEESGQEMNYSGDAQSGDSVPGSLGRGRRRTSID